MDNYVDRHRVYQTPISYALAELGPVRMEMVRDIDQYPNMDRYGPPHQLIK
jgi:hypothetical protein